MGPAAIPFLIGASAVSTTAGIVEQRKARKASLRANRAQERAAAIQNARERRKAQAQAKIATASNVASGASQGLLGSSTLSGITSSIQTQLTSNESFQRQLESLDAARFSALNSSIKHQSNAESFNAISGVASSFASSITPKPKSTSTP